MAFDCCILSVLLKQTSHFFLALLLKVEGWGTNISVHADIPLSYNEKLVEYS